MDYKRNSFNLVRLIAALQVLLEHAIIHLELPLPFIEKFNQCFRGVPLFFCMSGFLIAWSLDRNPSPQRYFRNRVLRVYPELWGGVIISSASIFLLYARNINVIQMLLFLFAQATILQFWTPNCLRGYGVGTPNGSLWSICNIVQFYILIYFLYKLIKKFSNKKWAITFALAFFLNVGVFYLKNGLPPFVIKLYEQTVLPYAYLYLIGIFVWVKRDIVIPYLKKYFWAILGMLLIISLTNIGISGFYIKPIKGILLCLLGIGCAYRFPDVKIKTDLSYGIYIYHMIFINMLVQLGIQGKVVLLFVVIVASVIAARLSHLLIKKILPRMEKG